jgi:hypothetical protein
MSQTGGLETSPGRPRPAPGRPPRGGATPGPRPVSPDRGGGRLPAGAPRGRPGLRRRQPAQEAAGRPDRAGLPQGPGPAAAAAAPGRGRRTPAAVAGAAGGPLAGRGLRPPGVRRHPPGMPPRRGAGAAAGLRGPEALGADVVADGPGAPAAGGAVGLALGPGPGQPARPPAAAAAAAAGGGAGGGRRRPRRLRPDRHAAGAPRRLPGPDVGPSHLLQRRGGAAAPLPGRAGLLLAPGEEAGERPAAPAGAADPGHGPQAAGRVAGDPRAGPRAAVGRPGGAMLPLAVGKRGAVPHGQAGAGPGEGAQAHGAAGASGGGGVAAGHAAPAGARGLRRSPAARGAACRPRQVLLAIRAERREKRRRRRALGRRRAEAAREQRPRRSPKARRGWPQRKPPKAPKPPRILTMTRAQKARITALETETA